MHKFRKIVSNDVDDSRYSYHKFKATRSGSGWKFQIVNYFDNVVYEQGGFSTQAAARSEGKTYRDTHFPKKKKK